jgi:hypothetical protein
MRDLTNLVVFAFCVPEPAQCSDNCFWSVSNLGVGVDEIRVLVRQIRSLGLDCKEESTSTQKWFEISIEVVWNQRKDGVQKMALTARPLQEWRALDLTRLNLRPVLVVIG